MSISRQEEIIGTLWIIAAVLAFGFDYPSWGWIFAAKGASDTVAAFFAAFRGHRHEKGSQ